MALSDLNKITETPSINLVKTLGCSHYGKKIGLSEERINGIKPAMRQYIAFWREYPDLFVDFIKGPDSKFKFYFYQRIFIRIVMRHRYVYATFPRA